MESLASMSLLTVSLLLSVLTLPSSAGCLSASQIQDLEKAEEASDGLLVFDRESVIDERLAGPNFDECTVTWPISKLKSVKSTFFEAVVEGMRQLGQNYVSKGGASPHEVSPFQIEVGSEEALTFEIGGVIAREFITVDYLRIPEGVQGADLSKIQSVIGSFIFSMLTNGPMRELRLRFLHPEGLDLKALHVTHYLDVLQRTLASFLFFPSTRLLVFGGFSERKPLGAVTFKESMFKDRSQLSKSTKALSAMLLRELWGSEPQRGTRALEVVVDLSSTFSGDKLVGINGEEAFPWIVKDLEAVSAATQQVVQGASVLSQAFNSGYYLVARKMMEKQEMQIFESPVFSALTDGDPFIHLHIDDETLQEKGLTDLPFLAQVKLALEVFRRVYQVGNSVPEGEFLSFSIAFKKHIALQGRISKSSLVMKKIKFRDPFDWSPAVDRLDFEASVEFSRLLRELQKDEGVKKDIIVEVEGGTNVGDATGYPLYKQMSSLLRSVRFSKNPTFVINSISPSSRAAVRGLKFNGSPPSEWINFVVTGLISEEWRLTPSAEMGGRTLQIWVKNSEGGAEEESLQSSMNSDYYRSTRFWITQRKLRPLPFSLAPFPSYSAQVKEMALEVARDLMMAVEAHVNSVLQALTTSSASVSDVAAGETFGTETRSSMFGAAYSFSSPSLLPSNSLVEDRASSASSSLISRPFSTATFLDNLQAAVDAILSDMSTDRESGYSLCVSLLHLHVLVPVFLGELEPLVARSSSPPLPTVKASLHSGDSFWDQVALFAPTDGNSSGQFQTCAHLELPEGSVEAEVKFFLKGSISVGDAFTVERLIAQPLTCSSSLQKPEVALKAAMRLGESLRSGGWEKIRSRWVELKFDDTEIKSNKFQKVNVDSSPLLFLDLIKLRIAAFSWRSVVAASLLSLDGAHLATFVLDLRGSDDQVERQLSAVSLAVFEAYVRSGKEGRKERGVRLTIDSPSLDVQNMVKARIDY